MEDGEGQFLDALYLGVRDGAEFDRALDLLCAMFDVASATLIDFDAARPDVTAQAAVGIFSGETALIYERDFAAFDPAPPAFMKQPVGIVIPHIPAAAERTSPARCFFRRVLSPAGIGRMSGRNFGVGEWALCHDRRAARAGSQSLR
jgi:hypothetical protein